MTKQIDCVTIFVKTKGFTATVNFKGGAAGEEHAYSNLMDLQTGLSELLGQSAPLVIGIDAGGKDDRTVSHIIYDDGWREWEGGKHTKEYPPGVKRLSDVMIQKRGDPDRPTDEADWSKAAAFDWTHNGGEYDIVAYKVLHQ